MALRHKLNRGDVSIIGGGGDDSIFTDNAGNLKINCGGREDTVDLLGSRVSKNCENVTP